MHRIQDLDGRGDITPDKVTPFIGDEMKSGASVDIAAATGPGGPLYILAWFPDDGDLARLPRLTDLAGSGAIDALAEAVEIWTETAPPAGVSEPDMRYAVEIDDVAFVDEGGVSFPGIAAGDASTFSFTTSDIAAVADLIEGTARDDRPQGTDGVDGREGGGGRYDRPPRPSPVPLSPPRRRRWSSTRFPPERWSSRPSSTSTALPAP
ncbi:MAG: hypothetical protein AAFU70_11700, partial [Planctomycetota bacterium]